MEPSSLLGVEPSTGQVYVVSASSLSGVVSTQVKAEDQGGLYGVTTVEVWESFLFWETFFSQITSNLIRYRTKCCLMYPEWTTTATHCKRMDCCVKEALCDVIWFFKVTVIDSGSNSVAVLSLNTDIQIVEDSVLQVEQWVFLHRVLTESDASECLQQNLFDYLIFNLNILGQCNAKQCCVMRCSATF